MLPLIRWQCMPHPAPRRQSSHTALTMPRCARAFKHSQHWCTAAKRLGMHARTQLLTPRAGACLAGRPGGAARLPPAAACPTFPHPPLRPTIRRRPRDAFGSTWAPVSKTRVTTRHADGAARHCALPAPDPTRAASLFASPAGRAAHPWRKPSHQLPGRSPASSCMPPHFARPQATPPAGCPPMSQECKCARAVR